MLVDTRGTHANNGATLVSTSLSKQPRQCLRFWYSMRGDNTGTLNVHKKTRNLGVPIWSVKNVNSLQWIMGAVTVPATNGAFQVIYFSKNKIDSYVCLIYSFI